MSYKVGMVSLGCPKNQVSAEIMLSRLKNSGFKIISQAEEADIVIINTCGFIEDAKKEAIDTIFDYVRMKNNGQIKSIVVTGCLAERYKEEILKEIPEVNAVVSIGADADIENICRRSMSEAHIMADGEKCASLLNGDRILTTPGYFAYLKVSDGCNNRCAYCAIPLIRGNQRSRTIEDIVGEAEKLADSGVKELIVVAQDTTRYGSDLYGKDMLPELLEQLCGVNGIEWIRIMYCYPERVSDKLLDVMAENDKIVKYMDLPIQHCNSDVLKRMKRRGGRAELLELIKKMRNRMPELVIRTTVMVGFPGETEEEFGELEEFIGEAEFDRLGCFAFSPEEDTPAAEMECQIDDEIKLRRREAVMLKQLDVTEKKLEDLIGKSFKVLAEGFDRDKGMYYGRSYMDAPDIDGRVYFSSERDVVPGEFVNAYISEHTDYDLIGKEVEM